MDKKIEKDDIIKFFKDGGRLIGNLALNIYGESLNQFGEKAFSEAIEIGIENTIASLYDAKVADKEIIRVVGEHWGIDNKEAEERLLYEKVQAVKRSLSQYMRLQGYTSSEISNFMKSNMVSFKIRKNKDWWKFKDNPEKIFKLIQK